MPEQMTHRIAALYSSFAADALSLGPHWIYNQAKLKRLYPEGLAEFDDPRSEYHPNRRAGQFTHYGDQALTLLRNVAFRGWSELRWSEDWRAMWDGYNGFLDGATRDTLANSDAGSPAPSTSNDLAGASRMVPLLVALQDQSLENKIAAVRAQTALTHGDPSVPDAAEFFVRAAEAIFAGSSVSEAISSAASVSYDHLPADEYLRQAQEAAASPDHFAASAQLGLTCHLPEAFPVTLHYALRFADDLPGALSANAVTGGDTSARAILLGLLLGGAHGFQALPWDWVHSLAAYREIESLLTLLHRPRQASSQQIRFPSHTGDTLDARLELPAGPIRAFALFAHCFTCGKDLRSAVRIARALTEEGIATLRFDFTGLGSSAGDFANTSFVTNIDDLLAASEFLRTEYQAPRILIGHSLGGAAVLATASRIPEARGVATIGAPADPEHVINLLGDSLEKLKSDGQAKISLAGRSFTFGKRFLDDFETHCQPCEIANLQRDLLIMHAPNDDVVELENARQIYQAARHPKSFVALPDSDHLLTNPPSADYAARIIGAWASRLA